MSKPYLSRIRIYPIKSLDPVELQEAEVGVLSLKNDRAFALLAADGRFINGKRTGRTGELKAEYDLPNKQVRLTPREGGTVHSFHLINDQKKLEIYFTEFFKEPVLLVHNSNGLLMDIPNEASVTMIGEASLESLHHDALGQTLDDLRLRFRASIEIGGVDPFWEETLVNKPGTGTRFTIGEVEMVAMSPRARCNVPPRNPLTGISDKTFVRRMMKSRLGSLPVGSVIPSYGNLYYLAVNTYIPESQAGKWIHVGDSLDIVDTVELGPST